MNIEVYKKPKLGQGQSFVLQISTIQAALADFAELNITVYIDYRSFNSNLEYYWLLDCEFNATSRPTISSGYISIHVGAVRSQDKAAMAALLKEKAFPALLVWIKKLLSFPPDHTLFYQKHLFVVKYIQEELIIKKSIE